MSDGKDGQSIGQRFFDWITGPPFLVISLVIGVLIAGLLGSCIEEPDGGKSPSAEVNASVATAVVVTPLPTPTVLELDDVIEALVLASIEVLPRVVDAAMFQDGDQISLVVVVDYATNESYAKQLGDNFVRLAKTHLKDVAPGKNIGKGEYDYLVGVYYPNEKQLALGAKSRSSQDIRW